jgi:hypothetical protein
LEAKLWVSALSLTNSHTFCKICIHNWLSKTTFCPVCRANSGLNESSRDLTAYNIINDLTVSCFKTGKQLIYIGCPWQGALGELAKHTTDCPFGTVSDFMREIMKSDTTVLDVSEEPSEDMNEIANFNTKGSLKARLYCKNKKLMENVFKEEDINAQPRDSLVSILDKTLN